jgi:hypothetical protein
LQQPAAKGIKRLTLTKLGQPFFIFSLPTLIQQTFANLEVLRANPIDWDKKQL